MTASVPTIEEVDRIAKLADPVLRNLRITHCYHQLSQAVAAHACPGANWCTFATWASRQAGQTIRGEDLRRAAESIIGTGEILGLIDRVASRAVAHLRGTSVDALADAIRRTIDPEAAFRRASEAVAAGNLKVFEEIGREFARWLASAPPGSAPDAGTTTAFAATLREGGPPAGQRLLRDAFAAYANACIQPDEDAKAEQLFLANLLIGMHEQTRLQPEITQSLNAAIDPDEIRSRLYALVFPAWWRRWRGRIGRAVGLRSPLDEAIDALLGALQRQVRLVITECLMTLRLPDDILRLGADVPGFFPATLQRVDHPLLREVLLQVDQTPDNPVGSGARDWSDLRQRMHFIADFFRTWHSRPVLMNPPFDERELAEISAGRIPLGRL
jgi:hypothetical protein